MSHPAAQATGHPCVLIHTDGSCLGNPGRGGFAAILQRIDPAGHVEKTRRISGGEPFTTNSRMELMAAIRGLEALKRAELPVVVVTDSEYVRKGITEWIANWKANGWRTSARKPVKNDDLWRALDAVAATQRIEWRWTKAHAGTIMNEEVDQLARRAARFQRTITS